MRETKPEQTGEVHVRVRLLNATDIEMAEQGILESGSVRSCEVDAVVDTGATESIISEDIVRQLGLRIRRHTFRIMADGSRIPTGVTSAISFEIEGRDTVQDAYVLGDHVLIGQTVLEAIDLLVDGKNCTVMPGHPDGPLFRF